MSNGSAHHSHSIVSPSVVHAAVPNGTINGPNSSLQKLASANEQTWLLIGRIAEQMGDLDHAQTAYENALRHNPVSLSGLTQVAGIARIKENYPVAVEYFQRVLNIQEDNGEVWSALGHCYLMQDDLQKAYSAYQQALYLLPNPKEDPKLWYGIGILYDRYGSLDHAEDAFASVLRMDKDFDKANEILFRLGIIYKQQGKYDDSLRCFDRILRNPPSPLAHADIWFQIGHVYEQQKDHVRAKDAYERVVADNPGHAKVLQQLGWLYHQDGSSFQNQDLAIQYLTKSLEADPSDAQSWYLLGRAYMAGQKYNKAYEAYQQAVYRDGRNPTFWCSIGVLYFQINQFRDALDAYSRAIRINPYISEVWFDLGSLYESCNNQISDAIDAYARASELDPGNPDISQRLELLKNAQATGSQLPAAPGPQDVHPTAYANSVVTAPGLSGPPLMLQSSHHRPPFRSDSRGPSVDGGLPLPPPSQVAMPRASPGPFRGGPPPPVVLDESRHILSHTPLAPMEVDRPSHSRDYSTREGHGRGPVGHQNLLLHHPVPQQHMPDESRGGPHHQEPFFGRPRSITPPYPSRARSPPPIPGYPSGGGGRPPVGPGQPNSIPPQRSPRSYPHEIGRPGPGDPEAPWDRRGAPSGDHQRDWDRDRRHRHSGEYAVHPYPSLSPERPHSPPEHSPRSNHGSRTYWDPKSSGPGSRHSRVASPTVHQEHHGRRYDPRYDARDSKEYDRDRAPDVRHETHSYGGSPELTRTQLPHHMAGTPARMSASPRPMPAPEPKERRKRAVKEKETDSVVSLGQEPPPKKERKRRAPKRVKEEQPQADVAKPLNGDRNTQVAGPSSFTVNYSVQKGRSPEPVNVSRSGSSGRSAHPSPTNATSVPPSRIVDEDYDEGVADSLIALSKAPEPPASASMTPTQSPTISPTPRHKASSRRSSMSHRGSISSSKGHMSPVPGSAGSANSASLKRPLTPGADEMPENKRSRVDEFKRRVSSESGGGRTPVASRPSPIPPRTQPTSHSPESRQLAETARPYPPSPPLPAVLPPHPRPVGVTGLSSQSSGHGDSGSVNLPPIATLSPASSATSPAGAEEQMRVDKSRSRSTSPPSHPKLSEAARASKSPG